MDMLPSVPEQVLGFIAVPDTIVAVPGSANVALTVFEVQPELVIEILV